MEKPQFIRRVAKKHHFKIYQTEEYLDAFLDEIVEVLKEEDRLGFNGFGTFKATTRPETVGCNLKKVGTCVIPERRNVKLILSRLTKKKLLEKDEREDTGDDLTEAEE